MLTKWDDLPIHQIPEPMGKLDSPDKDWLDSYWFGTYDPSNAVFLSIGLVTAPNTKVTSGYTMAMHGNVQYNFRASREMKDDRADTTVGPFSVEVIEPMRGWRIKLEENEQAPISYELRFTGATEQYLCKPHIFPPDGSGERWRHVVHMGHYSGHITIDGKDYEVKNYIGARDRFWGVRTAWMNLGIHIWIIAHFKDYCVFIFQQEMRDGSLKFFDGAIMRTDGENIPLVHLEHNISIEANTRDLLSAKLNVRDANGKSLEITSKPSKNLDRGITYAGAWSGEWFSESHGALHLDGNTWDFNDPQTRLDLAKWVRETICEFRCGDEIGHGVFEYGISRRYRKYGSSL